MIRVHGNSSIPAKSHHHLTDRQIVYLSARVQGKSKSESKKIANYGKDVSTTSIENSRNLKNALKQALYSKGFTDDFVAEKLMKGTHAKKSHFYTDKGIVTDSREVEDHENQYKYLRLGCELRGDLLEGNKVEVNLGLISIPSISKTENEWNNSVE